jgi:hypothetical protein
LTCKVYIPCTTRPENLCSLRRFVGRTPWSAADAPVGPVLVAATLLCGAGAFACQPNSSQGRIGYSSRSAVMGSIFAARRAGR